MSSRAVLVRTYRAAFGLLALIAMGYEIGHLGGRPNWSTGNYFSFFTILSNIFAAGILLAGATCYSRATPDGFDLLRGAATVYILTTGIVYALLLSGGKVAIPWVNTVEHQVMPIIVPLDWLLNPPAHRIEFRRGLEWVGFPLVYVAYTLVRGALRHPHWYPYPFLDPDKSGGYLRVAGNSVAIGLGILALIALVRLVGNRLSATHARVAVDSGYADTIEQALGDSIDSTPGRAR